MKVMMYQKMKMLQMFLIFFVNVDKGIRKDHNFDKIIILIYKKIEDNLFEKKIVLIFDLPLKKGYRG